jgi:hypothetical protein
MLEITSEAQVALEDMVVRNLRMVGLDLAIMRMAIRPQLV